MAQQGSINLKIVVLAVLCVILLVSTIGAFALYMPAQSQINDKDQTIADLNAQIAELQSKADSIPSLNSQISALQTSKAQLQDEWDAMNASYQEYRSIVGLGKSGILYSDGLTQDANATTTIWSGTVDYAGFVKIAAESNVTSTYAQLTCVYGDYSFAYNQTLGAENTVIFAVLPGTLSIEIGNINQAASVNATATYYY